MVAIPATQKSTTGRSLPAGPGRALRLGVGALDALAPGLAGRLAERLFLTPPRHAPPPWEVAALRDAEPFALGAGGTALRGHRFGAGPAVLLVHGWGGRGGQLAALAPPLVAAGCAVVAFDGPGHGASAGRTSNLARHAEAISAVARRFRARAAIAHSFGGAALALALRRGLSLDAAVLVGTPRSPRQFFDPFCAALGLAPETRERARRRVERRVGLPMDELDVPRLAGSFEVPALVVHDRADAEVPFESGVVIAEAWPRARLLATDGLGHRRILRDGAVAAEIAAHVLGALPRCACGRLAASRGCGEPRCRACLLDVYLARRDERPGFDAAVTAILEAVDRGGGFGPR
jgi:pimeloyl-ACP methyl ester carboxylesterase